ncbi:MAG: AAA family ATPase [Kiritimatiellae bacterium]|nr:AAA family ATPase [Kiritimatiellia bacterium]MDD5522823.1 AAA family ATPase [Kiritimatiellia bacterium]
MYLEFYNLREYPFNITPDPRFLYFARHHKEAYDHLMYGIKNRRGFIELTGEVGSGKTTLCRAVLANLGKDVETALILNPSLTETQLLRAMLNDFGLEVKGRDRLAYIEKLNDFLLERSMEGTNVALVIDEAQDLSPEVMEQVRLLSNLETDQQKLIQIVMCGQPELQKRLARPDLRQLRQRITVRYHIPPLTQEDTMMYIRHRLWVAGSDGRIVFDSGAIREVYKFSKGGPRVINAICDNSLLAGYVARSNIIDARCVKKAIKQLEGSK